MLEGVEVEVPQALVSLLLVVEVVVLVVANTI